jgi:hypothetical protein
VAYFGTGEVTKKYEKLSEQTTNGNTTVKYRNGNQNFTVVFKNKIEERQHKAGVFFIIKLSNLLYTFIKFVKGGATHRKQCTEGNTTY